MPTFDKNTKYIEAANNFRLALLNLSKNGLIVRRMQMKHEAIIEIEPQMIIEPKETQGSWHSAFIHGIRVIWSSQ
jgi:hypothetical protein